MVSNRTITNVSIPKRRGIQFLPEVLEVKRPLSAPDPIAQRTETRLIDASGLQGEPVGSFYDFELVAGANAESVQHARRKGDLAFCSYFDNQGKSAESHWTTKYAKRRETGLEAVGYERYEMTRNRVRGGELRNTRKDAKQG